MGKLLNERYRLEDELGQGGMGVVYRGYDTLLKRTVAIKVLNETHQVRLGTEGRARLLHEARSAAALNHPNIVSIFDAGQAGSMPFIVMELLEGESLYDKRPESLAETLSIAKQICAALEHAHQHGVVHRDLKPENVIISPDGTITLTDFGLARSVSSRLTADGMIVGTVFYMAPEMALRKKVDHRADLYSLGVILYELVSDCLPFSADDPLAVISQHLYAPVVPPHAHASDIPAPLDNLIVQLLSKEPDHRPATAEDVRLALELIEKVGQFGDELPPGSHPFSALDRLARGRFVGRERELTEANSLWRQALTGRGSTLLVSGEAGIGKTRLVRELITQAAISGSRVLIGVCYAEGVSPYAPFPQMIQETVGPGKGDLRLPEHVLADLIAITPELRAHYPAVTPNPSTDDRSEQQRVLDSIAAWCEALVEQNPVLLFIDDIHWADCSTHALLRHLARRAPHLRLLVTATYREIELDESGLLRSVLNDLTRERLATRIKLTRFSYEQTTDLLAAILTPKGRVDPRLVEAVYHETEGNPFFIEEVLKTLIEEDILTMAEDVWMIGENLELEIPQSVRLTIQTRLGRLSEQTQDVLRLAATFGRQFDFDVLQAGLDLDEDALIEALETAEQAQIIAETPAGKAGPLRFSFVHGLIPATLRDTTSGLRRQRLHRRAAKAIETTHPGDAQHDETLAYHYEQAGDGERAQAYYIRAGEHALSVYANQEAERAFRAAIDLSDDGQYPASALTRLGESLFRQSRFSDAIQVWREEIERCRKAGDSETIAYLYSRAARAAWYASDPPEGLAICREGMTALKALGVDPSQVESYGLAALLHETARACRFNNLNEEALLLCRQALAMAERLNLVDVQADTLATLGILANVSQDEARQALTRSVTLAEANELWGIAVRGHTNLGENLNSTGELRAARQHFQRGAELGRRMGMRTWEHDQLAAAAELSFELGEIHQAEETIRTMRKVLSEIQPTPYSQILVNLQQASLYRVQRKLPEAEQETQAALQEALLHASLNWLVPHIENTLADIWLDTGLLEEAEKMLASVLEARSGDPKLSHDLLVSYFTLTRMHLMQRKAVQARQAYEKAAAITHQQTRKISLVLLDWMFARQAALSGQMQPAHESYARVQGYLEASEMLWLTALLLAEWGQEQTRSQSSAERGEGLARIQQASQIFQSIDATAYANWADQLFQSSGGAT